jgi:hypothetical protein
MTTMTMMRMMTKPKEILAQLHLSEEDDLFITPTPDGIRLTPYDPENEAAMAAFERTRRTHCNALRELAQ